MIHLFLFAWLAGQAGTSDAMQHLQAGLEARKQHQIEAEIAEFKNRTGHFMGHGNGQRTLLRGEVSNSVSGNRAI